VIVSRRMRKAPKKPGLSSFQSKKEKQSRQTLSQDGTGMSADAPSRNEVRLDSAQKTETI